jgi:hypothetical protein
LNQEYTMHITKALLCLVPCLAASHGYAAATDDNCLNHLSGSSGMDASCYLGSADAIQKENLLLADSLMSMIPHGNRNAALLKQYMTDADQGLRFCTLNKQAGSEWQPSSSGPHVRNMWDSIYAECVYSRRKEQRTHLLEISDLAKNESHAP